jgi:hypothetical protein
MGLDIGQIVILVIGGLAAILAAIGWGKLKKSEGVKEGKSQAVTEVKAQTTEQTLERVLDATEARNAVERTPDVQLSDQARHDPNNRLGGV